MYRYEEDSKSDLKGSRKDDRLRAVKNLESSTGFGIKQPDLESQISPGYYLFKTIS